MVRFGFKCALFFAPLAGIIAFAAVSLSIVGELTTPEHVLALQKSGHVLFDQMYQPKNTYPAYKLLATVQHHPEILSLGSSRILSLHSEFIRSTQRFYNGYVFYTRSGAIRAFLEHLGEQALPRVLVLDIDPWWFRDAAVTQPEPGYFDYPSQIQILDFAWRNGLYALTQPWAMRSGPNLIGGSARLSKSGLREDGSFHAETRYFDRVPNLLEKQLDELRRGTDERFLDGSPGVSHRGVDEIQRLLNYCSAHHILLIAYLSTYHPSLYQALRSDPRQAYIWHIADTLEPMFQKAGAVLFDLQNPAEVGCPASEYLDFGHESEVCTAKVAIAMANRDSRAASIFDTEKIEEYLKHRPSEWQLGL